MLTIMFILVGIGGVIAGALLGLYAGQEIAQADAIRRGHARFAPDERGHTKFQWLPPSAPKELK